MITKTKSFVVLLVGVVIGCASWEDDLVTRITSSEVILMTLAAFFAVILARSLERFTAGLLRFFSRAANPRCNHIMRRSRAPAVWFGLFCIGMAMAYFGFSLRGDFYTFWPALAFAGPGFGLIAAEALSLKLFKGSPQ